MLFSAFAMCKQQVFTSHKSELHLFPVLSESFFSSSALRIHQRDPCRHLFAESALPAKRPFVLHEIRGDQKAAGLKNTVVLRQYLLRIRDNVQSVGGFTDQFPWQW